MNYTTLVSAETVFQHLDDPDWVIIDCRFTLTNPDAGRNAWLRGHVPGARYAHLDDDLSAPKTDKTGRHPLPDQASLARKLSAWGIDTTKQVVVYDDSFGAMAGRLWWLLRWLGHDRAALLDGGIQRWQREGRPLSTESVPAAPATFTPRPNPALLASAAEVMAAREAPDRLVLDARSEERFLGEIEPLDKIAGHIPGSRNRPFEDNLDLGGTFLSAEELRESYQEQLGQTLPGQVIHLCGSGVTACHNILAMEAAGLGGSKLYVGSWSEWITDPTRPIATGTEPER